MKCPHCSSPVQRSDWFCAGCRRALPRRRGPGAPVVAILFAAGAAVGAVAVGPLVVRRPPVPPPQAVPLVTVRPVLQEAPTVRVARKPAPRRASSVRDEGRRGGPRRRRVASARTRAGPPGETRAGGTGLVAIRTDSSVKTYVYLNGGSMIQAGPGGEAQLPAGRHTLVFWAPSIGGRARRTVVVRPGQKVEVVADVEARKSFDDDAGR